MLRAIIPARQEKPGALANKEARTKRGSRKISGETKSEKETGRVEAFSDGVFAVAITLLALDIHVPRLDALPAGGLWPALLALWPTLLAYVTSFGSILVMWLNHDRLFEHIQRKDHWLLLYNGLLLMVITLYPFPTSLVAEYLAHPGVNAKIAAAVFSALSLVMAIFFNVLWHHAADGGRLLFADHDRRKVKRITDQYRFGPLLYAFAFAAAFFNAAVSIFLSLALAVFFALPEKQAQTDSSRL